MMNKEVTYQISKVVTDQFATMSDVEIDERNMSIFAGVNYQVDSKVYSIRCFTDFGIMSNGNAFIKISVSVYYFIKPEDWKRFDIKDKQVEIPMSFVKHLADLTLATTRGILHAKTENTSYNKYIMPYLNADALVKTKVLVS
ncbi:hypothetical protein FEM33_20405 [Dyadobacter flavalbus]|uniref:Uncharacterized protein n=1 Tax=Dyadobacter flavalbus TaxID=2579942 RepID=A0A5M8QPW4_9BACT|nr:hypothetical protein [Dyadobacter flavalbus]KAA6437080.1 hypothetical protein FEM33_20405 [Dyadobacter flavalbus]